ncbi:MAG: hypothetical protein WCJ26_10735 [bacterium]
MIRILSLSLLLIANVMVHGQQADFNPGDPDFVAKYAGFDFKGSFAANIEHDSMNNYYLLDFSMLPTRFERVYFMNRSFLSEEIVNIDPDVLKNRVCFSASTKYGVTDVLKIFNEIKVKVSITASSWSDAEKLEWLKANDKYK